MEFIISAAIQWGKVGIVLGLIAGIAVLLAVAIQNIDMSLMLSKVKLRMTRLAKQFYMLWKAS